jgi:hypothetical protein
MITALPVCPMLAILRPVWPAVACATGRRLCDSVQSWRSAGTQGRTGPRLSVRDDPVMDAKLVTDLPPGVVVGQTLVVGDPADSVDQGERIGPAIRPP